jgi:hypothetical protein
VAQGKGGGEGGVRALVEQKGLLQISDPGALMAIVDSVLAGKTCILVSVSRHFMLQMCTSHNGEVVVGTAPSGEACACGNHRGCLSV